MMDHEMKCLLALANFAMCSAIGWACVCRISIMDAASTRRIFRVMYTFLFGAATASGFSPWLFGEWPGVGHVLLTAAFVFVLASGAGAWRKGLPDYARTAPAPLDGPRPG